MDIPAAVAAIETLASRMRATFAASGRRADSDAAYEFGEAAQHLRAGARRLTEMAAEATAREAVMGPKKRTASLKQSRGGA